MIETSHIIAGAADEWQPLRDSWIGEKNTWRLGAVSVANGTRLCLAAVVSRIGTICIVAATRIRRHSSNPAAIVLAGWLHATAAHCYGATRVLFRPIDEGRI